MSENFFHLKPEFIENDPRKNRPVTIKGPVTAEFMSLQQAILLPLELIKGKRILDLGACLAASGAWVLSNGATFYKGVEFESTFADSAKEAMSQYYTDDQFEMVCDSIENYLDQEEEKFDVVIAAGVLHVFSNPLEVLRTIARRSDAVVIESAHSVTFQKTRFLNDALKESLLQSSDYEPFIENEPFIEIGQEGMTVPGEKTLLFKGLRLSMGAVKAIMQEEGFTYVDDINQKLKKLLPKMYSPYRRYGALFLREERLSDANDFGFLGASSSHTDQKIIKW